MKRTDLKNIYNIPLSCSFWDSVAQIYLNKFGKDYLKLASALFLVPNRRACQSLISAFVRIQGLNPTILPQIVPITEVDDEALFFNTFNTENSLSDIGLPICKEERLFLFTRMIMSKPTDFGLKQISLPQAFNLALSLADFIDTAINQGLSFDRLTGLVPEKYAAHWQETLQLLKIITDFWPEILKERKAVDTAELKNILLYKQADVWEENQTTKTIVAAGITANFPAIIRVLKVISNLPNGAIYFAGIDSFADNAYWQAIDEVHPQFELKELLTSLNIERSQIADICPPQNSLREKFISEIMRPAVVSHTWQYLTPKTISPKAWQNIELIECCSQHEEALAIALKMREILLIPEKTAALITYDRNLARRVSSELERFDIQIDDSAGIPLNLTPIGIFLRLLIEASEDLDNSTKLIALLKHPLCLCHLDSSTCRDYVYRYELFLRQKKSSLDDRILAFMADIRLQLQKFSVLLHNSSVSFEDILQAHIKIAEEFSSSSSTIGKNILWQGDAGKCAAQFFTKIMESASHLGIISGKDYLSLICELMCKENVRRSFGTHPRLSILGPIEARLCHFDYVILGEINEGIWPKPASSDMWMSRPMKKDFGFSLPEKSVGILAADFCTFLASENVILTRAERIDGVPMKKSRWLLRIQTVLQALGFDIESLHTPGFISFVQRIDLPDRYSPISAPAPCPPVEARPRKLSASAVDLLVTDPYSVFAKYILRLYPLDALDLPLDQRDYGTLIHEIIEDFNNLYPTQFPDKALDTLIQLGKKHFDDFHLNQELFAFWWQKFVNIAIAYIAQDTRENISSIHNEVSGFIQYNLPQGLFTFTAKADRIDILKNNQINIIDYKTGSIPSKKQIMSGHALQLLLEGLIARKGQFENIAVSELNQLIYWHLGDTISNKNLLVIEPKEDEVLKKCEEYLIQLVSIFDFATTPYYSQPIPKYISKNRDYEHLARVKEWSIQEDGEDNE